MSAEKRRSLLTEAARYVTKDRNSAYGEPEDNFQDIADIWQAQGMRVVTSQGVRSPGAADVALFMTGMKLARLKTNPNHRDSWVDGIGYFACGGDIAIRDFATGGVVPEGEALGVSEEQRKDPSKAVNDALDRYAKVLVPDARCAIGARSHAGHSFGSDNELWCDGYVAPGNYGVGQPKPRPIKDSPQA